MKQRSAASAASGRVIEMVDLTCDSDADHDYCNDDDTSSYSSDTDTLSCHSSVYRADSKSR